METNGRISKELNQALPVVTHMSIGRLWRILWRYFPLLLPYWPELIFAFIIMPLAGSVIITVAPLCSKMVLDVAFPRKDVKLLFLLTVIVLGAGVIERTLMVFLRNLVFAHLRVRTFSALGSRFYENMMRLSMRYHHQTPVGEKIFRCDTDIMDVSEMMGMFIPSVVQSFWQFFFIIGAMCMIDWRPVAIAGACAPLFFLTAQVLYNYYRRVDLSQRLRGQELTAHLERTLSASSLVYSHGTRRREEEGYRRSLVRYSIANMIYWFMSEVGIVLAWPTEAPSIFISLIIGLLCGYWVVTDEMTIGDYTAMNLFIIQAIVPLGILITYYQQLRLRMVPAERTLNLLDSDDRILDTPGAVDLKPLQGRVEFRGVHFAYNPEKPVLQDLNFTIEPGRKIAFVGPSGIGKSTILNLILRFYDPDRGEVLVDGRNLRSVRQRSYRQQIGIVLQEPLIFDGTVRGNILYGVGEAPEEEIRRAVELAGLADFVEALPQGLETPLKGANLALGQKQRISLARCLVGRPSLVLLDEPTSLVDPASKQALMDAIERVIHGRTAIFVSHDLLTLRNLDEIIVLNQGGVAERGSHEQLLERKGLYCQLWRMQLNRSLKEQPFEAAD